MPKESIQYGSRTDVPLEFNEETGQPTKVENLQEPSLYVKWNRDNELGIRGFVQVQFDVSPEFIDHVVKHSEGGMGISSNILDRKEINHMIKTLRRARDAAYGADE